MTPAEALDLLRGSRVGRIAYSDRALPAIVVASYTVVDDTILLKCDPTASWTMAVLNAVVAFQADGTDALGQGWSVTCVGRTHAMAGQPDVLVLEPTHVRGLRISPEAVLAS